MAEPSLVKLWSQAVVWKAASLFFPREQFALQSFFFGPGRTTYNYAADVGDGLASSVVMPVVQFLMRAFPEAPLVVRERKDDELEIVSDHPLVQLVDRPNTAYPGTILWMATITDWAWWGESYWRILRSRGGQPAELWWIPPWSIKPKWPDDGSVFISHYDYKPSLGPAIPLDVEEVIHFRHGLDPRNMRHGLPPLRAVLQDIWVDAESNNFVGAMLRNMGIPGMILSPKGDERLSQADVEQVKAYISSRFTGDHRGEPLAFSGPTDVHTLGLSPTELDMSTLRNTAEERVCSALGIPSAVVGFKSGLENSKVGATMHEFVGLAWSNGIVPMQRLMAAELQRRLLPLFESSPDRFLVGWDYDEVKALEQDQNALAKRAVELYQGGVLMRAEARQLMGYEANDGDEIYLVPSSMTEEGPDAPEPEPLPTPTALPAVQGVDRIGNGNGSQNSNGAVQQRALTKQGGSFDEWVTNLIARRAPRMDNPPQRLKRLSTTIWRQEQKLQPQFQAMLLAAFQRYGDMAAVAAQEILFPQKQNLEDLIRASIIHERIPHASITADLAAVYAKLYDEMVDLTFKAIQDALDLAPSDPARIQAQIRMISQERVGLLDLSTEARQGIIRILEESRQLGLDEQAMVDAIKDQLPAGRWSSSLVRAQIVARTEARLASNLSTAAIARDQGLRLLAFDGRLGPTDETCMMRNGLIVSAQEAQLLAGAEHPSGTLGFAPISAAMAQSGIG